MAGNDFFEGVRTLLIDRKDKPNWTYTDPLSIPDSEILSYFEPLKGEI
jgi:hypothetical protein